MILDHSKKYEFTNTICDLLYDVNVKSRSGEGANSSKATFQSKMVLNYIAPGDNMGLNNLLIYLISLFFIMMTQTRVFPTIFVMMSMQCTVVAAVSTDMFSHEW